MIKAVGSITGHIKSVQSIKGKINNLTIKELPELENLEVNPTKEKQVFEGSYGKVVINAIECEELIITPTEEEQVNEGMFNKVTTKGVKLQDEELEASFISSIDDSLGANITKLPSTITSIGDYAFFRTTGLKLNKIEQEITNIGTSAFNGCSNLNLSEINSSVLEIINATAFASAGITELDIKSPVLNIIGNNAFQNSDLEKIIIRRTDGLVTARTTIFSGTPIAKGTGYIYVPNELVEQYKTASNWSVYASQIKGVSEL